MKRFLTLFAAAALALAVLLPTQQVFAAGGQIMCQGDVSGASTGSRTVVNTSSTASPQPSYTLNSGGCAYIALADIGFFQSLGYTQPGSLQSIVYNTGVQTGTTDIVVATLPANAYIREIIVSNSVAAAVTGGISFGTTANGTDIVTALTCGASCLTFVADSALSKRVFSLTAQQAIHAAAVTAWNSTNVTITIVYGLF
jgi:hypothetical protein